MKSQLKNKLLWMVLAAGLGGQSTGTLQAQAMQKDTTTVVAPALTREMPKKTDSVKLDKSRGEALTLRRGHSGRHWMKPPRGVLETNRNTGRLPDSRLPEKEEPAKPKTVLKKVVL